MNMRRRMKLGGGTASRRGTIMVAVVIALVLLQLIVVGVVTSGARDHDLTGRRAETLRALYASEAGMNMSVRELYVNIDEDGDGTIGSISGDGNDANDPTVPGGGGRMHVTKTVVGLNTTLRSTGRSGLAQRRMQALVQ